MSGFIETAKIINCENTVYFYGKGIPCWHTCMSEKAWNTLKSIYNGQEKKSEKKSNYWNGVKLR